MRVVVARAFLVATATNEGEMLDLVKDSDAYRWYAGRNDLEVSGESIAQAIEMAELSWRSPLWRIAEVMLCEGAE